MSADAADDLPAPAERSVADRPATGIALVDPADRGSLTVADRVIEKTAARAASEVENTVQLPRRMTDRLPGRQADSARAVALVTGRVVRLQVSIAIRYPASIVAVTRDARHHVRAKVSRLCDVEVRDVDVVVTRLRRDRLSAELAVLELEQ